MRRPTEAADVTPIHRVRSYEELDGGAGREVFFRPQRYRAAELSPLRCELSAGARRFALLDVSESGAAIEWPRDEPVSVGDRLDPVSVCFDGFEAFRGEARVGSVREADGSVIVGLSFEGPLLPVDDVLHLRTIKAFAAREDRVPEWQVEGMDRFKVLVSELRLFLEDHDQHLTRLEADLPWHVVHGEPSPAQEALAHELKTGFVHELVRRTEEIDSAIRAAPPSQEQSLMQFSRRHLHPFFMLSPSMARCANKPFGYPGDYEVMRFIYERPFEGTTLFAKALSLAFDATRAPRAVRHRKDLMKRRLRELIDAGRPVRALAIASGPAQELFEVLAEVPELQAPLEIVLFDQDKGALAYAFRRLRPLAEGRKGAHVKLVYLHDSIKRLLRDPALFGEFGEFDVVYSVGLFDYFKPATAVQLARNLYSRVAEGGSALIANMTPDNPSRWYMEHHLDWQLVYRTRAELLQIGRRAAPSAKARILEEESGVNPFVELSRT